MQISVAITSYRSKGYASSSSNDYYLTDRAYKPSQCTCCVFPYNGVPLNPRFFNGVRQSSLIYFPSYKRLVMGGRDWSYQSPTCDFDRGAMNCCQCSCTSRVCCRVSQGSCGGCNCGVDRGSGCCGSCYPVKESCGCSGVVSVGRRRGTEGRLKCVGWEKSEGCDSGADDATEELMGLLTKNDFGGRKEKKSRLVAERDRAMKRGKGGYSERDSRDVVKSVKKSSEEDFRSARRKKSSSRDKSRELRIYGSNRLSYHSLASSDDSAESDVDVHVKHENFGGESSSRNNKESTSFQEDVSVKKVIKQTEKSKDEAVRYREVLRQRDAATQTAGVEVGSDLHVINEQRKQFMDVPVQQEESRTETLNHRKSAETAFVSQNRREDSISNYSVDGTREQCNQFGSQITQHDSSRMKSQQLSGMSQIQQGDNERASSSRTHFRGREENLVASVNLFKGERGGHSKTGQIIGQSELRRNPQQPSRMLESHDTSIRNTSTPWTQFESTSKNGDQRSTRAFHRAEELDSQTGQQVVRETKSTEESVDLSSIAEVSNNSTIIRNETEAFGRRMSSQEETSAPSGLRMSENHESNIGISTSQRLSESSWKNSHESSTSLRSSFHGIEDQNRTDPKIVWEQSSTKVSQDETNISMTKVNYTEIVGDSLKRYERRMRPGEETSVSHVDLVQDTTQRETEHGIKQHESRKEFDKPTEISTFQRTSVNRASSSQQLNPFQQESGEQIKERKENERNSLVMVTPPPSQTIDVTPLDILQPPKSTSKTAEGEVYSEMPERSTVVMQEGLPCSLHNLNGGIRKDNMDEDQSMIPFNEDALGSASRLEESSSQFVRQLVENLSHEVSMSEFPDKKTLPEITSSSKDVESTQQCSNQATTEIIRTQVDDSRRTSSRSGAGARGPADEIWDVAGSFSEEPGMTEAPSEGNSTTKSTITKTGRSLWNIIGDIIKLRWGAHSATHISTMKSGGKSSSNESVGSEAWFSSHEGDEKVDENVKKGRKNTPKVHGSFDQHSLAQTGNLNLEGASEGTNPKNQISYVEADAVSSLDAQESSSASKSASSSFKTESISVKLNERGSQQMPPGTTTASSPSTLPSRQLIRSPAVKGEIPESSKGLVSRSDILQMEQPAQESQTDAIRTEMNDGELIRRRLQRKKQVEKEHFEEWEEAYRLESEQRKIDEMFMKEALLEAKTAADTWEVPVGAVLVQDGKIIARGCNLVEDLRDSTAHAEMICIREASKTLRTWRLAETTLYVTLEPCAMCAGAILQARIDTVVYGAPNKLLGADGSWVRLFPGGSEGSSSESTSQSAGPVHPFHPKIIVRRGVLATECADVMQQFFQLRRKKRGSNSPPPPSRRPRTSSLLISNHPSKFISKMHDIFHIMFCL